MTDAGETPESLYWYAEPFLRTNIGLTQHSIGQYRDAADSIRSGMAEFPADQQNAGWEYRQALDHAAEQTDGTHVSQPQVASVQREGPFVALQAGFTCARVRASGSCSPGLTPSP